MQLHHHADVVAGLQRFEKIAIKPIECLIEPERRIIKGRLAERTHRFGEQRAVKPCLVAKIVADCRHIDLRGLCQRTHRGLFKAVLGKEFQPGCHQAIAGFKTINPDGMVGRRMWHLNQADFERLF